VIVKFEPSGDWRSDRLTVSAEIGDAKLIKRALQEMCTRSMTAAQRAHRLLLETQLQSVIFEAELAARLDGASPLDLA
jgi:hypothetical protein